MYINTGELEAAETTIFYVPNKSFQYFKVNFFLDNDGRFTFQMSQILGNKEILILLQNTGYSIKNMPYSFSTDLIKLEIRNDSAETTNFNLFLDFSALGVA